MSKIVEQCRREWKRLGVPDPLAEEMALDLASDLREAEAEGVSTDELLGSNADPRSFAASWAGERGIIPVMPSRGNARRRPLVLVAFTAVAAITLIVTALLLLTGQPKVALVASRPTPPHLPTPPGASSLPPGPGGLVQHTSASTPVEWILLLLAIIALGFAAWLWSNLVRSRPPSVPA